MTFESELGAGLDQLYAEAGASATYTNLEEATTSVTAILSHDLEPYGPDAGSVSVRTVAISVRKTELSDPPRQGESYTIAGVEYVVHRLAAEDELEHTVLAAK